MQLVNHSPLYTTATTAIGTIARSIRSIYSVITRPSIASIPSILGALIFSASFGIPTEGHTADDATVIMYHRFGEDRYPSTSVKLDLFESHLATIAENNWEVLPLAEIVRRLQNDEELPDKVLAISVDDAFLSVYTEAFPRFKQYGFPFTLFIATESIDQNLPGYANWDQIREMRDSGLVDIGSQSHTHPRMQRISFSEARQEIERSNMRFMEELGERPTLFAYPFGEYSVEVRDLVRDSGFVAAFGQQSGIAHKSIHNYEWPRFSFSDLYGSTDRLKRAVHGLPIPITDVVHEEMVMETNPPVSGFTVADDIEPMSQINCYASGVKGAVKPEINGRQVLITLPKPFTQHSNRVTCTMPEVNAQGRNTGRWRWFGRQFIIR